MPLAKNLIEAAGNASEPNYIESVFSTYLYPGNSGTQNIVNGIDLSTKGGMVWIKGRDIATNNLLFDTNRGVNNYLVSDGTNAQANPGDTLSAFNANGFTVKDLSNFINETGFNYASWTFRKQPKFFDVVTYTGNGASSRVISHLLGSTPGFFVIKNASQSQDWWAFHQSAPGGFSGYGRLNTTGAWTSSGSGISSVNSTSITVDVNYNSSGDTWVVYFYASNAGGFGLTGTDNVISCGSYAGNSSTNGPIVNLGYEPQWVMIKNVTTGGAGYDWIIADNMRGIPMSGDTPLLEANLSGAETGASQGHAIELTATGFQLKSPYGALNNSSNNYIYIAIRRGPMKVPTDATKVFAPATRTGTGSATSFTGAGFPVDFVGSGNRNTANGSAFFTRLQGAGKFLYPFATNAEISDTNSLSGFDSMTGFSVGADTTNAAINYSSNTYAYWNFRRAPSTHDEVCYTGNPDGSSALTLSHNLGVVPEMMIVKSRTQGANWVVYSNTLGNTNRIYLNTTAAASAAGPTWNSTDPTASNFTVGYTATVNNSGQTYVAYLFATCAGVSKVGSYTGNGSTQAIACGFTGGSRFVLIKATSTTGNWICVDTARGMTTSSNPVLYLNSTAAETATSGACITSTGGFTVDESKLTGVNTSGVSYIFLSYA